MGFRFRKSINFGPIRMALSKSGISTSIGVKGLRVTKRADGKVQTTASIPHTGISYTQQISNTRKYVDQENTTPMPPQEVEETLEERPAYEHIKFYLENTTKVNSDGEKRQDILYRFKMSKPSFAAQRSSLSLIDNDELSLDERMQISIDGQIIGEVPAEKAAYLIDNIERIDAVTALEISGRKGSYDAEVYVRLIKVNK